MVFIRKRKFNTRKETRRKCHESDYTEKPVMSAGTAEIECADEFDPNWFEEPELMTMSFQFGGPR